MRIGLILLLLMGATSSVWAQSAAVSPPTPLEDPAIVYPDGLTQSVTGVVAVRFTVTVSGTVTDVTVLSANYPAFSTNVVEALLATPFAPATQDGAPFAADIEVEIEVPPPVPPPTPTYSAQLSGTVFELGSRRPVAGAQLNIIGQDVLGSSDGRGRFQIDLAPGTVTVAITAPGYNQERVTETVAANERLTVIYRLRPTAASPLELVVEAERERAEVSRVRLDTRELQSVPGTFDDAIRVVQKLPSVAQANEFSGELIVRGSDSRDTDIYLDGIVVPFVFHFGSIKSILATELIREVVLYPSNFSVRYGDAIGGILDVRIKDPESEQWQGRALVSSLLSEAYGEGPVGERSSLQIGARSSYAHLIAPKLIPDRARINFSTFPVFRDYQMRFVHSAGDWTVRAFAFGAQDELSLVGKANRTLDPDSPFSSFSQKTNQHSQTLNLSFARGPVTGKTLVGHTRTKFNLDLANDETFEIADDTITLRSDWTYTIHPLVTVALGSDWFFSRQDINIFFPRPPRPGEFDYDFLTAERLEFDAADSFSRGGAYAELRLGRSSGVNGAVGVRLNYDTTSKVETADPRGLLLIPTDKVGTFKAGYGVYHQYAQGMETAPDPVGNPDAGPNRAHHAMVGWQDRIVWNLDAQVELFYKWIDHLITENPEPLSAPRFQNWGEGRVYGAEFSLRKPLTDHLLGWVNYSYTRSFRRIQSQLAEEPFIYDQPHVFNLIISWLPSSKWEIGGALRVASGNPREELQQWIYFGDNTNYIPILGELTDRERPYLRLDTRLKRTWRYDRWNLAFLFETINTTNYKNVLFTNYNERTKERETVTGFPFFPYVGLEAKF